MLQAPETPKMFVCNMQFLCDRIMYMWTRRFTDQKPSTLDNYFTSTKVTADAKVQTHISKTGYKCKKFVYFVKKQCTYLCILLNVNVT